MLGEMLKMETIFSPPVLLLIGLFLVFISILIFKFFRKKKEKISYQLTIVGFLILLLFFPLPKNFFSANLNIQTRLVPQPKTSQIASPAKKQAVKITSQNLKAGQGLTISDNLISLSRRNTQGTFGSANKIPQITVDSQGRIEKVVEKDVEKITEAEVDDYVSNNGYLTEEEDGDSNNELNLSFNLSGDNLNITDNGGTLSVNLSKYIDNTESINELGDVDTSTNPPVSGQILSWNGNNWVPASTTSLETVTNIANQVVGHKIADYTNENGVVQDINETVTSLALNGNSLDYTDEDGTITNIDLSGYLDNTDNQALSFDNITNTLSLTNGGNVDLSSLNDEYSAGNGLSLTGTTFSINSPTCAGTDKLQWNGTSFVCSSDVDTTYSAGTGLNLSGTTFSLNAGIDLLTDVDTSTNTPTNNQTLKWDGSNWVPADDNNTTYTASGTLLNLSGNTFSVNEGTLTDTRLCIYEAGTGLVCNTDPSSVGSTTFIGLTDTPSNYGTNGYLVQTNGSNALSYVNPSSLALGSIDQHSDVDTSTNAPSNGDLLTWDGSNWVTTSSTAYTTNIYTADGTLGGNRTVNFGGNNLAFDTDKLFIDGSSGNLGAGTATPRTVLEIFNNRTGVNDLPGNLNSRSIALLLRSDASASNSRPGIIQYGLRTPGGIAYDINSAFIGSNESNVVRATTMGVFGNVGSSSHTIYYTYLDSRTTGRYNNATFKIDNNNRIGIALPSTTRPRSTLGVRGNASFGSYAGNVAAPSNGMIISGNVGIGTSSPSERLHVSGDMRLTGAFYDANNQPGTAGQILSSTATGTDWVDVNSISLGSIDQHSDVDTSTTAPTNGQTLKWDGSNWVPADDDDTTYFAGTGLSLSGTTFSLNAGIDLLTDVDTSTTPPGNGDILTWDGSNWVTTSSTAYTDNIYTADGTLTGDRTVSLGGNNLYFVGSGNIGIGTSSPVNKLQVNGNVRATRFVSSDGTAGSPAFRFSSDADTGMFRAGTNQLAFTTGGNERVRIASNGRVGIGTPAPDRILHISGNDFIRFDRNDTYGPAILQVRVNGSNVQSSWLFGPANVAGSSGDDFTIVDYGISTHGTSGNVRLLIDKVTGNIGIGTTAPSERLHVAGNARLEGALYDSSNSPGTNGQILSSTVSGTDWVDVNSISLGSIDQHSDVDTSTTAPTNGQTLKWDGSNWVPADDDDTTYFAGTGLSLSGTTFSLNAGIDLLTDVDTSTTPPGNGDILTWDGSNWVTTSSTAYTDNIYTADGTLTGDRTVSLGGNDLVFDSDKLFINGTNGNVGIGTNSPLSRFDIANHIVFDKGDGNVSNGSDVWFDAQGLLSADSNMLFNIDADNNSTSEYFRWSTNSDSTTGALELMRLTEGEGLDVANHAAVGANAGIVNNQTLRVTENFNIDSNSVQIQASGIITSPTLTADRISYGGYFYLINNKTEDIANGYDSDGTAVYGFTQTNGTHTFRYNRGGLFEARNSSNATSDLGNLYGVVGVARQYASDDAADVTTIIGSYGQSVGYSGAGSTAGDINMAYGSYANVYPYKSNINTAYGIYGYISTNNGYDGDIGTAYGIRGQVRVDSDDGGDITNGYGGYFSVTKRIGANNMINATALYAAVAAANTAYAGRFYANSSNATTNYGLYINVANASTNNYGIYAESGDWILDEDGDGVAGGTGPGGDLMLGESQDLALYHNGTNSYIQNNTGDLIINGNNNNHNLIINNFDLIGIGTVSPSYDIDVDRTGSNPNRSARIRLRGSSSGYTNAALILQATSGTNYRGTGIFMHDEGGDNEWFAGRPYADSDKYIIARLDSVANVDESVAQTSNALLTVQNDGNVGIGISVPTDTLHVAGSLRVEGALKDNNNSAGTAGQVLTATATGFEWQNPTSCVMGGAKIQGNGTVTNSYGIISSVNRTNTGRYTINFSQSVNTNDYYVHLSKEESTSTRDDVNIDISAYNTNNVQVIIHEGDNGTSANTYRDRAFSITLFDANCTALSAVVSSDRRLKRNIENIEPETALDKVLQLQGVSYKWDTVHHPFRRGMDNKPEIGFIAQDVQKVLPEVVNVEKDGYLSLEYGKIMAVTVEALKDIWNNVQDNQAKLDKIKNIIQEAEEERKHLSDNINSLADLNTQITATLENHEERIADLESKVNVLEEMIDSQDISLVNQEVGTVKQAIKDWAQHIAVIEKQGQKITFDLDGNLKVKNLEAEALTTAKFTVSNQDVEEKIVGEGIIPAGETKIRINNKVVNEDSYILLTPRQPINVALGKIKKGEYFEIKISEALDKDLKVQWFIINEK